MYSVTDDIGDEIRPNPRPYPTFPLLPRVSYATNANEHLRTSNRSVSSSSDASFSSDTTVLSASSLQDCSIVSVAQGSGSQQTNSCFDFSSPSLYQETVAANIVEMKRKFTNDLTDEDRRRGFRVYKNPDPRYLGFVPSSQDKRKYLSAIPLASIKSPTRVGFYLPVSTNQKVVLFVFVLIVLLLSAAGAYFFRSMIVGDIVLRFRGADA